MKLTREGLQDKAAWETKGYKLPMYDREAMIARTKENPFWIHFGAGNIFRAFQANVVQNLLNEGVLDRGLIVAEGYDYEIIEKKYRPNDNYSILVTLRGDGSVEKTVVGSIAESCILDSDNKVEFDRLIEIFSKESLQLVTFTITEKGYSLTDASGKMLPAVERDMQAGPEKPESYIGKVAALLYARFQAGALPIAMVSTDNCSHNGDKLFDAMNQFAIGWAKNGKVNSDYVTYVQDSDKVSFPWSMIDKITPRPDPSVEAILKEDGLEDLEPVITSKNTYVAPFVNAEETEYLVIQDAFPAGRPALEKGGLIFTDQETVDKVERMKVCTCLNPLHTAMSVMGCLLGHTRIFEEMKDNQIVSLIRRVGYVEGLPVVTDPGVIKPSEFIDTVLGVRLPNPFMPDAPQRIATDTSQKLAIRFGETVKNYKKSGMDLDKLEAIPLVFAGWLRYLMALDDKLQTFELSSDPMLEEVCPKVAYFKEQILAGEAVSFDEAKEKLTELLSDVRIFGVDLNEVGLADKVLQNFVKLCGGAGAVRETLKQYEEKWN